MRKFVFSIALLLSLTLCVFAFASCNKKAPAATTTDAATTTAVASTEGGSREHVHVWDTDYTVDPNGTPTCTEAGSESIYCSICREMKPGSTRPLAALGHTSPEEGDYTVDDEPTCTEAGSKSYHCTVCRQIIEGTSVPIPAKNHVWATDYTVDQKETCVDDGSQSIHCTVCQAIKDGSSVPIPSNPNSHVLVEDVKIPNLLDPTGYRKAECSICHVKTLDEVLTWEPEIFSFASPSGKYYDADNGDFTVSKTIADIRGDQHFFKTSDEDDWKNLYFEYSILWNPTLVFTADARISVAGFRGFSGNCELFGLYTRDYAEWHEYGGRFDMNKTFVYGSKGMDGPDWTSSSGTATDCIQGDKTYKGSMDDPITENSYPAIGQYGWHRIGFEYNMSTQSNSSKQAKDTHGVLYWATSSLYIDGVKVWEVRNSIQGYWNGSNWINNSYALRPNYAMPWIAIQDGKPLTSQFNNDKGVQYNGIWYAEIDTVTVNMTIPNIAGAIGNVYVAIDDPQWSCGGGFVRQVLRVDNPEAGTVVLDDKGTTDTSDDLTCSGKVWFRLAD